jgi:hypothetical protein
LVVRRRATRATLLAPTTLQTVPTGQIVPSALRARRATAVKAVVGRTTDVDAVVVAAVLALAARVAARVVRSIVVLTTVTVPATNPKLV